MLAGAVPLFFEDGEWRMLFTERAAHMRSHPGDVAFPGGKRDVGIVTTPPCRRCV